MPRAGSLLNVAPGVGDGGFGTGFEDREPPDDHGGGGSGWVSLLRARNDIDAHLIVGRLTEAGVETAMMKDRGNPGAWLQGGSDPWAPVTILVRKIQLEDARVVLAEVAYDAPDAPPQQLAASRWRGPLVWWVTAIALGLLFTGLGLLQAANDMEECSRPAACEAPSP
jgi:hypothetical protein